MSCCNRRKPILAQDPVGALRYAWLRAPPSHQRKPTQIAAMALTYKSPYEGDSALSRWFRARTANAGKRARRIAIVALARKLIVALWRYLTTGLVPEQATMKA